MRLTARTPRCQTALMVVITAFVLSSLICVLSGCKPSESSSFVMGAAPQDIRVSEERVLGR